MNAPIANCVWQAQEGPQTSLITCPVFEVFFGGARGGGKTDGALGDFIRHAADYGSDAIGIMFRRERTQLIETIERSRAIYGQIGCQFHEQDKVWRFPNGARLRFAYLERDADAEAYQGHSYTRVYVEEIGTFPTEGPILKLMATLRSGAGVPVGFRATGNPGGPGHLWVKRRYIDSAPGGWRIIVDPLSGLERVYIPSRVSDNHYLGPDYVQRLRASGSAELVRAWLEGDWNAIEGAFFHEWSNKNIVAPFDIPPDWIRFRSGDWGSASPFSIGWWAVVQDDFDVGQRGETLPRGALVRYREWYGTDNPAAGGKGLKLTAEQVGEGIAKRESSDGKLAYGVMDPSAFREDGGPSIMERLNGRLTAAGHAAFRAADNTRVASAGSRDRRGPMSGWDAMRARILGKGGRPMVYCFDTCVASIRTIPVLQHDVDRAEDLDTESEDHCFAGETLVETPDGRYPIERLPEMGTVLSLDGKFEPYRSARMTRRNVAVIRLTFANGRQVTCTKDHRFLVNGNEWRYAKDLAGEQVLCVRPSSLKQFRLSTAHDITGAGDTFSAKAFDFISWCGRTTTDLSRKVAIFTTKTMTGRTMISATSNVSPSRCTSAIGTVQNTASEDELASRRLAWLQYLGTPPKKVAAGTLSTSGAISNRRWNAKSLRLAKNVVPIIALARLVWHKVNIAARTVGRVRCVSVEEAGRTDVYCLTVPSTGCFAVEGGLIASNCADDWRYACSSRPWRRYIAPEDPVKDAYRPPGDDMDGVASSVKLL